MSDDFCSCPLTPFADDPYYQCAFCERRQEAADEATDGHLIYLEERPSTRVAPPIRGGYFGPVPGVGMNQYIYARVDRDKAWTFSAGDAVRHVQRMRDLGYPARCEPPVLVTY